MFALLLICNTGFVRLGQVLSKTYWFLVQFSFFAFFFVVVFLVVVVVVAVVVVQLFLLSVLCQLIGMDGELHMDRYTDGMWMSQMLQILRIYKDKDDDSMNLFKDKISDSEMDQR